MLHDPAFQALASASPQWKLLADYMKTSSIQELFDIWAECDQATGPLVPSVFVTPEEAVKRAWTVDVLTDILGHQPSEEEWLEFMEPVVEKFFSPFWSATPLLNETQADARRNFLRFLFKGSLSSSELHFEQVGFWLSRDTGALRVEVTSKHSLSPELYRNGAEWWHRYKESLEDIGWKWQDADRPRLLDEVMPQLLGEYNSDANYHLDITQKGFGKKLGFTFHFHNTTVAPNVRKLGFNPNTTAFAEILVRLGLCSGGRLESMKDLEKPQRVTRFVGGIRYRVAMRVSHIKLVFEPAKKVQAKLYTNFIWHYKGVVNTSKDKQEL
eukprot:TRINITY_DN53047_c0_g1_i2.p1 TRINITY_DN53047_c0_g1~~TRINITY_DN53047_c0_g1_i2.p1  ORF type:complete len:326 (+),score=87.15 TRINITY_DN53047_c0_g1_i2:609-1586(+)